MANPIGQSFAPLGDEDMQNRANGNQGASPVQEAIKTLSMRMPRTVGAGAPAPAALLNSLGGAGLPTPMGGGQPDNPLLEALKRLLGGALGGSGLPSFGGGVSSPLSALGGSAPPPSPMEQTGKPRVQYQDLGGGVADDPRTSEPFRPERDMGTPIGGISGRSRVYSV
jgi:hypothetical protein